LTSACLYLKTVFFPFQYAGSSLVHPHRGLETSYYVRHGTVHGYPHGEDGIKLVTTERGHHIRSLSRDDHLFTQRIALLDVGSQFCLPSR